MKIIIDIDFEECPFYEDSCCSRPLYEEPRMVCKFCPKRTVWSPANYGTAAAIEFNDFTYHVFDAFRNAVIKGGMDGEGRNF